ncbi:hypothetical protein VCHC17A1_1208A, partial [Vibrio cholerae HC-17A1]
MLALSQAFRVRTKTGQNF